MNAADQEVDRKQDLAQQPAEEQSKSRLPVKRLRPWFGIALLSGVAAATAAVWVSATRPAPSNSTNDAVRNERPDESWLNHEPDRFAKADSTPTPAPVTTPTQPMTVPSYQPPQNFQASAPVNPDADYQRQEYRKALASDLIVTAPGRPAGAGDAASSVTAGGWPRHGISGGYNAD
jgi:hypothetical protein